MTNFEDFVNLVKASQDSEAGKIEFDYAADEQVLITINKVTTYRGATLTEAFSKAEYGLQARVMTRLKEITDTVKRREVEVERAREAMMKLNATVADLKRFTNEYPTQKPTEKQDE